MDSPYPQKIYDVAVVRKKKKMQAKDILDQYNNKLHNYNIL